MIKLQKNNYREGALLLLLILTLFINTPLLVKAESSASSLRISGSDRYQTAIEVVKTGWPTGSDSLILTTGENYPDALSAAPLAKKFDAPILLTHHDNIDNDTLNEIKQLGVNKIYVIGGNGVISDNVTNTLSDYSIQRIAGNDRFETAVDIAENLGPCSEAFIVTGEDFPDALSVAPIAAEKRIPVLLVAKNYLPNSVKTYLTKHNITKTIVIGDSDIISSTVVSQLPNPERIKGLDCCDRCVNIINKFSSDLDFTNIYLATALNFPDALAGSALAAKTSSPILLIYPVPDTSTQNLISDKSSLIKNQRILGGTAVISDHTLSNLSSGTNMASTTDNNQSNSTTIDTPVTTPTNTQTDTSANIGSTISDGNDVESQIKLALSGAATYVFKIQPNFDFSTVSGVSTYNSEHIYESSDSMLDDKTSQGLIEAFAMGCAFKVNGNSVTTDATDYKCTLSIRNDNSGIDIKITRGDLFSVNQGDLTGVIKGNTLTAFATTSTNTLVNNVGNGMSASGNFTVSIKKLEQDQQAPLPVTNVKIQRNDDKSILLTWDDPNPKDMVESYDIYRTAGSFVYFDVVANVSNTSSWVDTSDEAKKDDFLDAVMISYYIIVHSKNGQISHASKQASFSPFN